MALKWLLTRHWLLTLLVMGLAALVMGVCSLNLFYLLRANLSLIDEYGLRALMDGALEQLVELSLYGVASLLSYVVFKACEKVMVGHVLREDKYGGKSE
jgi:hypothetical protein